MELLKGLKPLKPSQTQLYQMNRSSMRANPCFMVSARKGISFWIPSVSRWSGVIVSIISFSLLRSTFESAQTSNSVKIVSIPLGGGWLG